MGAPWTTTSRTFGESWSRTRQLPRFFKPFTEPVTSLSRVRNQRRHIPIRPNRMRQFEESSWLYCLFSPGDIKRTDATLAGGICGDVEFRAEAARLRTIVGFGECLLANAAYALMKEAGAHVSAGLDDGRKPGGVAARSLGGDLPQVGAKVEYDATEFVWAFGHESVLAMACDHAFDLLLQPADLLLI